MTTNRIWKMGVPVATPVTAGDCLAAFSAMVRPGGCMSGLESQLRDLLAVGFVRGANSGRSALYLSLQAMKRISSRREVVIPAFICPSVARAAIKAGLKPVLCDVGPAGSGLDLTSLKRVLGKKTLAVVTAHLHGLPVDIAALTQLSRGSGAMVIEDCAQAFGAKYRGHYVGTAADVGIFSFGMSKVLWSMGGGVISTSNSVLAAIIDEEIASLPAANRLKEAMDLARFAALALIIRSHHLGLLDTIWSTSMRGKDDCEDFDVSALPATHAAVAAKLLERLAEITRMRKQNAEYFSTHLAGVDGIAFPNEDSHADSVFLRFPVIVHDPAVRRELLFQLRQAGVNASTMYTEESCEALKTFASSDSRYPVAEYLACRVLNLPTHAFMREQDLRAAVNVFHSLLGHRSAFRESGRPVGAFQ